MRGMSWSGRLELGEWQPARMHLGVGELFGAAFGAPLRAAVGAASAAKVSSLGFVRKL